MNSQALGFLLLSAFVLGVAFFFRKSSRQKVQKSPPPQRDATTPHAALLAQVMEIAASDPDALIRIVSKLRDTGILQRVEARSASNSAWSNDHGNTLRAIDNLTIDKLEQLAGDSIPSEHAQTQEELETFKSNMEFYSQ